MNNKKLPRKTTSAIFLVIVLVAGTFAVISPSFMVGTAQAQPYYNDMNKEKKSDRSVTVQSLKCNNINVNINGLELSVLPPFLGSGLATEAQDANTDANSFASNGGSNSGFEFNDFRFICINNNNNTVVEDEEPLTPITPVEDECAESEEIEACFEEFLSEEQFPAFETALNSPAGIIAEINGENVTLRNYEDICLALEGLTLEQLPFALSAIIDTALAPPGGSVFFSSELITCIAEAFDIPIPSG